MVAFLDDFSIIFYYAVFMCVICCIFSFIVIGAEQVARHESTEKAIIKVQGAVDIVC